MQDPQKLDITIHSQEPTDFEKRPAEDQINLIERAFELGNREDWVAIQGLLLATPSLQRIRKSYTDQLDIADEADLKDFLEFFRSSPTYQ